MDKCITGLQNQKNNLLVILELFYTNIYLTSVVGRKYYNIIFLHFRKNKIFLIYILITRAVTLGTLPD